MTTNSIKIAHDALLANKLTISCAESLTSGLLQSNLSTMSGSSKYFIGGVTAYAIAAKASLLGVNKQEAIACNAVSESVATAMASGCANLFATDIALATTGYAEAYTDDNGVSYEQEVFVALWSKGIQLNRRLSAADLNGLDRLGVQQLTASVAIEMLLEQLSYNEASKS
ncbi:CinA family protein [Vibrio splendidus]|nr:nicotinamide-nucleotide amidohydrolase family protein [Vibrio splendidus]MCC4881547.1 nicotinamide-nucleotide amidohydrolase family protein [Vibrio splendidus]